MSKREKLSAERYLVKNNLKYIYGTNIRTKDEHGDWKSKSVVLYPGWNSVKANIWDSAEKNPLIMSQVESTNLRVKKKTLAMLDEQEAVEVVREISDPRYLKIIKNTDDRSLVKLAANDTYDLIMNPNYENE